MLSLPAAVRLYVATAPTDMRKGFDGLVGLARGTLREDPMSGHIFLFTNRRRTMLRALWWDRTGFILLSKRLERGTFAIPAGKLPTDARVEIDVGDLYLILEGVSRETGNTSTRWYRSPHPSLASRNTKFSSNSWEQSMFTSQLSIPWVSCTASSHMSNPDSSASAAAMGEPTRG